VRLLWDVPDMSVQDGMISTAIPDLDLMQETMSESNDHRLRTPIRGTDVRQKPHALIRVA
jgi:hypothetical protein